MNKKIILALNVCFMLMAATMYATAQTDYTYLTEITSTSFLPAEIHAGDTVSMALDVKNKGAAITIVDLNALIDVGNQFEPIQTADNVGSISAGSTKTIVFRFKIKENTFPGYYPVSVLFKYNRDGSIVEQTQTIFVSVSKTDKNIDVTVEPRVINPGKQTDIVFSFANVGGTPVSNISFSWSEENSLVLPLGSDNKRYIPVILPGTVEKVTYTVAADPNITPGIYPLDVAITFTDVNGSKTQESQVGLIIGGKTDFEVSAETLSTGQLSISIANIGSNNAGAVVVRIPQQDGIRLSASNTAILGNLNKGDFTIANFSVQQDFYDQNYSGTQATGFRRGQFPIQNQRNTSQVQENSQTASNGTPTAGQSFRARTANQFTVEIDYTDTTGERQSVQKTVQLSQTILGLDSSTIAQQFRQRGNTLWFVPWALLALIIIAATAFNRFKAGNDQWKKLAIILATAIILFMAAIFLLNSDLLVTIGAGIISTALLAWFFIKKQKK